MPNKSLNRSVCSMFPLFLAFLFYGVIPAMADPPAAPTSTSTDQILPETTPAEEGSSIEEDNQAPSAPAEGGDEVTLTEGDDADQNDQGEEDYNAAPEGTSPYPGVPPTSSSITVSGPRGTTQPATISDIVDRGSGKGTIILDITNADTGRPAQIPVVVGQPLPSSVTQIGGVTVPSDLCNATR